MVCYQTPLKYNKSETVNFKMFLVLSNSALCLAASLHLRNHSELIFELVIEFYPLPYHALFTVKYPNLLRILCEIGLR